MPNSNDHSLFGIWRMMKQRCNNPYDKSYKNYGGRGIQVCEAWNSFWKFATDVISEIGERPSSKHTLDRKNNEGNYEPGNIRWATQMEQNRNRRDNCLITANGETLTQVEWAAKLGVGHSTLSMRRKRGKTDLEIITASKPHHDP